MQSREDFAKLIENIIKNPSEVRKLQNGRTAYWDNETGTVVIHNPRASDQGTTLRPSAGIRYFRDNIE